MNKSNTPFKTLRDAYSVYNQTPGKSPATIRWYDEKLELFERFIGPGATLTDVTVATVRTIQYTQAALDRGLKIDDFAPHLAFPRDAAKVATSLQRLEQAAAGDANMGPLLIEAVENYVTLGEICHTLLTVWGEQREATAL